MIDNGICRHIIWNSCYHPIQFLKALQLPVDKASLQVIFDCKVIYNISISFAEQYL